MDPLRTRVKAAAVANLTDARYFAALGVDYLGFALEPGAAGHVSPEQLSGMRAWIEGPAIVGEFGHAAADEIARQAETLRLDVVQVGPFGKTRDAAAATGLPVLHEIVLGADVGPTEAQRLIDGSARDTRAFVLDFSRNGITWDALEEQPVWMTWLTETCADYAVLLDVPAAPHQLDDLLATLAPEGVQLTGGEEEAVGVKSFDELDEWFEVLRVEEEY